MKTGLNNFKISHENVEKLNKFNKELREEHHIKFFLGNKRISIDNVEFMMAPSDYNIEGQDNGSAIQS